MNKYTQKPTQNYIILRLTQFYKCWYSDNNLIQNSRSSNVWDFFPSKVKRKYACALSYNIRLILGCTVPSSLTESQNSDLQTPDCCSDTYRWTRVTASPSALSQMNTVTLRANMAESESLETVTEHERILQEIESTDTACVGPTLRWEMSITCSYLPFRWRCDVFPCPMDGKQAFVC